MDRLCIVHDGSDKLDSCPRHDGYLFGMNDTQVSVLQQKDFTSLPEEPGLLMCGNEDQS